jgi:hypothetical protein
MFVSIRRSINPSELLGQDPNISHGAYEALWSASYWGTEVVVEKRSSSAPNGRNLPDGAALGRSEKFGLCWYDEGMRQLVFTTW